MLVVVVVVVAAAVVLVVVVVVVVIVVVVVAAAYLRVPVKYRECQLAPLLLYCQMFKPNISTKNKIGGDGPDTGA